MRVNNIVGGYKGHSESGAQLYVCVGSPEGDLRAIRAWASLAEVMYRGEVIELPTATRPLGGSVGCVVIELEERFQKGKQLAWVKACWVRLLVNAEEMSLSCVGLLTEGLMERFAELGPIWWTSLAMSGELLMPNSMSESLLDVTGFFARHDAFEVDVEGSGVVGMTALVIDRRSLFERDDADHYLVGRHVEMRMLRESLTISEGERDRFIVLSGAAGIGKTTLLGAAVRLALNRGFSVHRTRCVDYKSSRRNGSVALLVASLMGLEYSGFEMDRDEVRRRFQRVCHEDAILGSKGFILADLMDLPLLPAERSALSRYTPEQYALARTSAISALAHKCGSEGPVFIVLEDIHWADSDLLGALMAIMDRCRSLPVFAVATTRIEGSPLVGNLRLNSMASNLRLNPLSSTESREMARKITKERRLPWNVTSSDFVDDELIERCLRRAAGNPLFLVKLLESASAATAEPPTTLQVLLLRHLENLSSEARSFLECAACVGDFFSIPHVRALVGASAECVEEVERSSFLRRVNGRNGFSHAVLRDAILSGLSESERAELHSLLAESFNDDEVRAEHWARAGDERAYGAFVSAAHRRRENHQLFEALALLERAREVSTSAAADLEALLGQGEIFERQGEGRQSLVKFDEALALLTEDEELRRPRVYIEAMLGKLAAQRLLGLLAEVLETVEILEKLIAEGSPGEVSSLTVARFHYLKGSIFFTRGALEACSDSHMAAIETLETQVVDFKKERLYAQSLSGIGDAQYAQGNFSAARTAMSRCIELARAYRFGRIEVTTLNMLGVVMAYTGNPEAGFREAQICHRQAREVGDARATLLSELNMALPLLWAGRAPEAMAFIKGSADRAVWIGSSVLVGMTRAFLAHIYQAAGRSDEARDYSEMALNLLKRQGSGLYGGVAYGAALAIAGSAQGPIDEASVRTLIDAGVELLSGEVVSHNYLYFSIGAVPVMARLGDIEGLRFLKTRLESFFSQEREICPEGCVNALISWVGAHLGGPSPPSGLAIEQPLLAAIGVHHLEGVS